MAAAIDAIRERGAGAEVVSGVVEAISPSRLKLPERLRSSETGHVEGVLRLLEMTPKGEVVASREREVTLLRIEASHGLTDGDVLSALVSIATLEPRPEQFRSMISLLEDRLGLLVEEQELQVAADVARKAGFR